MAEKKSFLNAIKWAYTGNWGEKGFSALFTVILAAFLGPRDFGVVAIAIIYIAFLQLFLDQGLAAALIQRKEIEQEHLDAVFWMDFALGVILVLLSIACSRRWAATNHTPEIARIIPILSVSILIEALAMVQTSVLRREMDFRGLSLRSNVSVLVSGVVGLGMAFAGFRVWALVGQQIVKDLTGLILLWKLSPWRPRFEFSWPHLKPLLAFSIPNFIAQLGVFAGAQAGSVVLGLFFGPLAVGLYRVADRVMTSVVNIGTASIQAVSLPEFSRLQKKPEELRKSVLTCINLTAAVTLPALAGLGAVSAPLMATIGPSWAPASNVLKILSLLGMFLVFGYFTGPLLQALCRPHHLAILEWSRVALDTCLLLAAGFLARHAAVSGQVVSIASARFVSGAFIGTPLYVYTLMRLSGISFRRFTAAIAPSALASVAVVSSVMLIHSMGWATLRSPVVLLIMESAIGGVTGLTVLFSLEGKLRRSVGGMLQRSFG
jgi:PST family polysaccharide transporter